MKSREVIIFVAPDLRPIPVLVLRGYLDWLALAHFWSELLEERLARKLCDMVVGEGEFSNKYCSAAGIIQQHY